VVNMPAALQPRLRGGCLFGHMHTASVPGFPPARTATWDIWRSATPPLCCSSPCARWRKWGWARWSPAGANAATRRTFSRRSNPGTRGRRAGSHRV